MNEFYKKYCKGLRAYLGCYLLTLKRPSLSHSSQGFSLENLRTTLLCAVSLIHGLFSALKQPFLAERPKRASLEKKEKKIYSDVMRTCSIDVTLS